jgi:4-hydroxy-2-oxoglutarate aldolase
MGVPGIKAALDLMGMRGGNPRPPLLPLAEKRRAELRQVLETAGLLREEAQAVRG